MSQLQHLVSHLWKSNKDEIISRSLLDCHCIGLHSIMLLECPEKTIRLYVATPDHQMWRNTMQGYKEGLSVGFHPHHCDITLHGILGDVINWSAQENESAGFKLDVSRYIYQSKITHGELKFQTLSPKTELYTTDYECIKPWQSVFMRANRIHTIGLAKGKSAAWMVYEGKEDKEYVPYLWSNTNPNEGTEKLYRQPTESDIINLLSIAGLPIYS